MRGGWEGDGFLGGHDFASAECDTDDGLGGGASAGGVGSGHACDREGGFGDFQSRAVFGEGGDILAALGSATGDGGDGGAGGGRYCAVNLGID